jgi:hypothetical protein
MKLTQINRELTPEKFFLPRDTGEVQDIFDDDGQVIGTEPIIAYDQETEMAPIEGGLSLKRKSKDGIQELRLYDAHSEIWHLVDGVESHIANGYIYLEYLDWDADEWIPFHFAADTHISVIDEHSIKATLDDATTGAHFEIDITWRVGNAKQEYYAKYLGQRVRVGGYLEIFDDSLIVDYSDFIGIDIVDDQIDSSGDYIKRYIKFASDGVEDELTVDPYIGLDEESDTITVSCDGYDFELQTTSTSRIGSIKTGGTERYGIEINGNLSSTAYRLAYDTSRSFTVLENTANRAKISYTGVLKTSGGTAYTGLDSNNVVFWIYPDRFVIHLEWVVNATTATIDNTTSNLHIYLSKRTVTNNSYLKGTADTETTSGGTYDIGTYNYLGGTCDEANQQMVVLDHQESGGSAPTLRHRHPTSPATAVYWNDGTLPEGTHSITAMFIIDSADRAGSAKLYNSTARIAIGNQYTDSTLTDPNPGDAVTGLSSPDSIGSSGFASDGAWHFKCDASDELSLDWDRTRYKPAVVLHDWPCQSGSTASPTDHTIGHWKCDDNAASATVVATEGTNAEISTGNTSTYSVLSGTALDTQGSMHIDLPLADHDNAFLKKGGIQIIFTPQHAVGTSSYLFGFRDHDGRNRIYCQYNGGNTDYYLYFTWGGTFVFLNFTYNETASTIGQRKILTAGWDDSDGKIWMTINGIHHDSDIHTGTLESDDPTTAQIGAYNNSNGDNYIHDVKTFNTPILPYGAYFVGNGSVDTDVAHSDILFYWDCESLPASTSEGVSPQIGSETIYRSHDSYALVSAAGVSGNGWTQSRSTWVNAVVDKSIVPTDKGSIAFWALRNTAYTTSSTYIFSVGGNGNNSLYLYMAPATGNTYCYLKDGSGNYLRQYEEGLTYTNGVWYHFSIHYDVSAQYLAVFRNGVQLASAGSSGTLSAISAWASDCNIGHYTSSFGGYDEFYITNSPYTPETPTANGVPIHSPIIRIS